MSFFKAIQKNNLILVKKLIERGADVNAFNIQGETPLTYASRKGHLQIVKYLVKHGADVNYVNADHTSALAIASASNKMDVVKYLVENTGANWFGHSYNKGCRV
jgi:ankyrin repeat protein